jgi:hypothetical protein
MQEEMQSLEKNGTWNVMRFPKQKNVIRYKWNFKRKENLSPNKPSRFKARLVAKVFSYILGIDYNNVFYPVVKHSSIRAFSWTWAVTYENCFSAWWTKGPFGLAF